MGCSWMTMLLGLKLGMNGLITCGQTGETLTSRMSMYCSVFVRCTILYLLVLYLKKATATVVIMLNNVFHVN